MTITTTLPAAPTASQFGTLKVLFADVIDAGIPGIAELRVALLSLHREGRLSDVLAEQAITLLAGIINPCNDDMPPRYLDLPATRPYGDGRWCI